MFDSARQVIRWSIPGAILMGYLASQAYIASLVHYWLEEPDGQAGGSFREAFVEVTASWASGLSPSLVAGLIVFSIPVGFLIYQFYYSTFENSWRLGNSVTKDRGEEVLQTLYDLHPTNYSRALHSLNYSFPRAISRTSVLVEPNVRRTLLLPYKHHHLRATKKVSIGQWRKTEFSTMTNQERRRPFMRPYDRKQRYALAANHNWHIVVFLISSLEEPRAQQLRTSVNSLSDIYHGLGATRAATVIGMIVAIPVDLILLDQTPAYAVSLLTLVNVPASWLIFRTLTGNRTGVRLRLVDEIALTINGHWNGHRKGILDLDSAARDAARASAAEA